MEAVVREAAHESRPSAEVFVQNAQRGTADAVLAAKPALDRHRRRRYRSLCRHAADPPRDVIDAAAT